MPVCGICSLIGCPYFSFFLLKIAFSVINYRLKLLVDIQYIFFGFWHLKVDDVDNAYFWEPGTLGYFFLGFKLT